MRIFPCFAHIGVLFLFSLRGHGELYASPDGHALEREVAEGGDEEPAEAALGPALDVADGVGSAGSDPRGAQAGGGGRVVQAGDEEPHEEGGLVLDEVAVRPLRAVEGIGFGVLGRLLLGGVRDRVLQAARLARLGAEEEVQDVDEEGGRGGDEDVAVVGETTFGLVISSGLLVVVTKSRNTLHG